MSEFAAKSSRVLDPVVRTKGLARPDIIDWDEVNETVQSALAKLDTQVASLCPGSRAVAGRNRGEAWELFSYRVYQPPVDELLDAVVVGIQCATEESGIRLHADICGENLGDILAELKNRTVVGKLAVLEAARNMAEELTGQANVVATALHNRKRAVE